MVGKIYLDHHRATRPFPASVDAMLPFLRDPGETIVSNETILDALGASAGDRFYFFSSSAEAINHLYFSHYFDHIRETGKNHLITTNMEEASSMMALKRLEELGCTGKILSVNTQGQLTKEALEEVLRPRTSLVSLSWANGLTGVIHPIADLAAACHAKDVRLHVDASYVIGKLFFRFEDLPIDFLTFDGSLIHAPQGTAGLLVKERAHLSPPFSSLVGVPVGSLAGLSHALEESLHVFDHVCLETARLRDKLEQGVMRGFPEAQVLFSHVERLPNCTSIAFPRVASDALLFMLHRKGVTASMGGGHYQRLSHILHACGMEEKIAECALSFSLSYETTEEEIDHAVKAIVECAQKLRGFNICL